DGKRIRLNVYNGDQPSLWEVNSDGSNPHKLFAGWHEPSWECCGFWTQDGRYYIFSYGALAARHLFAVRESGGVFRKDSTAPVQLTSGPLSFVNAIPSLDGKRLFLQGTQRRGETVRYDTSKKQFLPFMEGTSVSDVAYSRDGKWMVYV